MNEQICLSWLSLMDKRLSNVFYSLISFVKNIERERQKSNNIQQMHIRILFTKQSSVDSGRCNHQVCSINGCQMHITKYQNISPNQFNFSIISMLQFRHIFIESAVNGFGISFIQHTSAFNNWCCVWRHLARFISLFASLLTDNLLWKMKWDRKCRMWN